MEKLTNKEEEIMMVLWKLKKAFVKEVLEAIPAPKPHYNTLSTIIRNLQDKGYVSYEAFGNTHRYFPKIEKEVYRKQYVNNALLSYFDNSYTGLVSHFAKEKKISVAELKEIIALIEQKK
ncbi:MULTISPECIES: BlaI/MecI/CopY family transcriptional regulator [Flavobacteriaceae]|uniref:BlaI/MecI/CopY family transcriptional regulator n=1 Tax=Flavobacteriaceae TaxID=49546 RepID=UPI0010AEB742|nr:MULTISPECIES: BlaI/MecI/CopY family transcriptional regulator [Flavobacteriaceae]NJB37430.1 BlaI/MecI/CopY family transcriptional regulator [Croceivirga sp. JEA036]TKD61405.1 BlaI/MecI/CopY family transcriptional regulator [Flavobacterium sp. ASW18X]